MPDNQQISLLIDQLNDPDLEVQVAALLKIAQIGEPAGCAATKLIEVAERDDSAKVSSMAIRAIGKLGGAAKSVIPRLAQLLLRRKEMLIGRTIARALGELGHNAELALDALKEAKRTKQGLVNKEALKAIKRIQADIVKMRSQ